MKKSILAAIALVALASCDKENSAANSSSNQVAVSFTSAAITRVADNAWEANDKIGVSMTLNSSTELADGEYENVPYTVSAAGVSGTFSPDNTVVYFPVDGSEVDFYAYYPYSTLDDEKNIAVNVATQSLSDIDIVAAKAYTKTKTNPTVTLSGEEAFEHQLSKLSIAILAGDGISDLTGLTTTIKGQCTTAKYNIYSDTISSQSDIADITALTDVDGSSAVAILIPTDGSAGSSIVFTLDGDEYIWDTADMALSQGSEHSYEITVTKTRIIVSGATISNWNDGADGTGTAE